MNKSFRLALVIGVAGGGLVVGLAAPALAQQLRLVRRRDAGGRHRDARAMGIEIPSSILLQADLVVE